jgi:hypothetical protein
LGFPPTKTHAALLYFYSLFFSVKKPFKKKEFF